MSAKALLTACLALVVGCARARGPRDWSPQDSLIKVTCPELPLTRELQSPGFRRALHESMQYFARFEPERQFVFGTYAFSAEDLKEGLLALHDKRLDQVQFTCFAPAQEPALMTGYYEGTLRGSRAKTKRFSIPVYGVPQSLVKVDLGSFISPLPKDAAAEMIGELGSNGTVRRFPARETITSRPLKDTPLLYVDDEIELFFAHIQGSTVVEFPDRSFVRLGFAERNGHPYKSIGKYLIERGALTREKSSMQDIISFLRANPDRLREVLNHNPSYIFFRELSGESPVGSTQAKLTPRYAIATDKRIFPPGAMALLRSEALTSWHQDTHSERLVFNQDTGGAIVGPQRLDYFVGRGPDAEQFAGKLRAEAHLLFVAVTPKD